LAERAAVEVGVLGNLAAVTEDDRVHPKRLLDRSRDELRLGDESLPVGRVLGEVPEQVAELATCRVEARQDEDREDVQDQRDTEGLVVDRELTRSETKSSSRGAGSRRRSSSTSS